MIPGSILETARGPAVKICGLTRSEDVIVARNLGVWALGIVFAPSPRRLEPEAARQALEAAGLRSEGQDASAHEGGPIVVGVFTEAEVGEIVDVVQDVGLDAVQLHGLGGPGTREVAAALEVCERKVSIIRAVPVDPESRDAGSLSDSVDQAVDGADMVLLDTKVANRVGSGQGTEGRFGGSGTRFCWDLARGVVEKMGTVPLIVAGGIDPDNVLEALSRSGAWGVDVSSGVESSPGVKDAGLMEKLVAKAREGR